jgi:GntR family transcriptional regulator/MocR family aminotransferase
MTKGWTSTAGRADLHLDWKPTARPARALADALRAAIRSGQVGPGAVMPSTRALAADLGLARGTVSDVYGDLAAEGYLTIRHGAPTRVAAGLSPRPGRDVAASAVTREPIPRWNLVPGTPDVSAFPRSAWTAATRRVMSRSATEAFGYIDPLGHPQLRRTLANYVRRTRGVLAEPDQVIVGSGFAHLLAWWAHVARARGVRTVAFENPSLDSLRLVATRAGLRVVPVDVDDEGLRVADLDAPAVALTPSHQYPLGVTLGPNRRAALVRRAIRDGLVVLEDDYDGEFRFDRRPVGALQAMAPEHISYAGTTSKTLAPGLRLAWLVVPHRLVPEFRATAPALGERHPSSIEQLVLADLIETGGYDRHVRRMRAVYRRRRDRVLAAVEPSLVLPGGIAAGLHLLLQFPAGSPDEATIARVARRHGLAIGLLGPHWFDPARRPPGIVVGYAAPADHAFTPALAALRTTLAALPERA